MHFDRTGAEPEGSRNLLVATATRHFPDDLQLTRCQTGMLAALVGRRERLRRQCPQPQRRLLQEGRGTERIEQVDGAVQSLAGRTDLSEKGLRLGQTPQRTRARKRQRQVAT